MLETGVRLLDTVGRGRAVGVRFIETPAAPVDFWIP
jgi:hypothetical protein